MHKCDHASYTFTCIPVQHMIGRGHRCTQHLIAEKRICTDVKRFHSPYTSGTLLKTIKLQSTDDTSTFMYLRTNSASFSSLKSAYSPLCLRTNEFRLSSRPSSAEPGRNLPEAHSQISTSAIQRRSKCMKYRDNDAACE